MSSNIMNSKKKRLNLSRSNKSPKTTSKKPNKKSYKPCYQVPAFPALREELSPLALLVFGYAYNFQFYGKKKPCFARSGVQLKTVWGEARCAISLHVLELTKFVIFYQTLRYPAPEIFR